MSFIMSHLLSIITFLPLVGALFILATRGSEATWRLPRAGWR